jgi:acyl-CoA thioesterase FadM
VDYHSPTPINTELEIRGKVIEIKGRKVIVELQVNADGVTRATGTVVMVQLKGQ